MFQVFCSNKETPGLINEYMSELSKYVGMDRLLILEKLSRIHYPYQSSWDLIIY